MTHHTVPGCALPPLTKPRPSAMQIEPRLSTEAPGWRKGPESAGFFQLLQIISKKSLESDARAGQLRRNYLPGQRLTGIGRQGVGKRVNLT